MKQIWILLMGMSIILVIAACASPAPAPTPQPTATPVPPTPTAVPTNTPTPTGEAAATSVRVIVPPAETNFQIMNFWIALGAGFFKEEGIDVEIVRPPNPFGAPQFLIQGRGDVCVCQPPLYMGLIGQEQPILVFANLLQNDPINLVVRKEVVEARKLSPSTPLPERLKGMQGLRIGAASQVPPRLRTLFATAGMDIDRDIQLVDVPGAQQNQAFEEKRVDALYTHTPHLEVALVEQGGVLLVNQSGGEVQELNNMAYHSLVTTKNFAGASPKVIAALTRGVYRAQKLVHADQKAAVDAMFRAVPGLDRKLAETIVAIYEPAIPKTPDVSIEGMKRTLPLIPIFGARPDLNKINLADYIAPQFAKEAVSGP